MGIGRYILVDRQPVEEPDLLKWGQWLEKNFNGGRIVRQTHLPQEIFVSTIFLALDHSFGDGKPVLFESMIFGGRHDHWQKRYCTWGEAEKGHEDALRLARSSLWVVIDGGKKDAVS